MKQMFTFIDPQAVMSAVVALVVLGVGVFTFFISMSSMPQAYSYSNTELNNALRNQSFNVTNGTVTSANNVFNIIGVVMIIAAIMSIIGLIYTYVR